MTIESINPATGETLQQFSPLRAGELEAALAETAAASRTWQTTTFAERAQRLHAAAAVLRAKSETLARLITLEMGKPIREARAEVEKCAWGCEYYAEHAEAFLRDEPATTDAARSYIAYRPLGTLLAIMPWNFPLWQAFRAAAPALMAGNGVLLKHASNVPQCALAVESVFAEAGLPRGAFRTLLIGPAQAEQVIADARVHAVTLTGSESAGRRVAALAGQHLKKTVLELGGSDAFVVLEDADLDIASSVARTARFQNTGQSCIAAKRFVVLDAVADEFVARFARAIGALRMGDPLAEDTDVGPMARSDLRDGLHAQVQDSIRAGATLLCGGAPRPGAGYFYTPTLLDHVRPGMRAYEEELFGPVAMVIRVPNEQEALRVANDNRYGLGASVWTTDHARGERLALQIESGMAFVNGMVKSDPRLPFGGVKCSGYGRELSLAGIREFVNAKTIWIR